jgi:XTP/dITP diphosphohydrolase
MKLIIASNNKHKIYEIKTILAGKFDEILSLREAGIDHETVEDGNTFLENAEKKAREISAISGAYLLLRRSTNASLVVVMNARSSSK